MTRSPLKSFLALTSLATLAACGTSSAHELAGASTTPDSTTSAMTVYATVVDTQLPVLLPASGIAAPREESSVSTKLMATVLEVLVNEGDVVRAGQLLVRLDGRELDAKAEQVAASLAAAEAMHAQAAAHAARMRALFADSAAPKAALEAAEASLEQASAGLRVARAAGAELRAVGAYADVRAPFAGRVTRRFVDRGAFAAPGAPLMTVEDAATLRITAQVVPNVARALRVGQKIAATIEGVSATATIEGIVPVAGSLYAVNAIVENRRGAFLSGSAATLHVPAGNHRTLAIPADALEIEGDLTGVRVRTASGDVRRWVRIGVQAGEMVEVTSGLREGEQVVRRAKTVEN